MASPSAKSMIGYPNHVKSDMRSAFDPRFGVQSSCEHATAGKSRVVGMRQQAKIPPRRNIANKVLLGSAVARKEKSWRAGSKRGQAHQSPFPVIQCQRCSLSLHPCPNTVNKILEPIIMTGTLCLLRPHHPMGGRISN